MALRQIVKEGDSVLTKKCRPVVKFDDRLADLIDDMIETLHKAEGVGLAAPQVGILRRVVVIDVGEGPIEHVNPKIIAYSGKQETLEGCLSIPGKWGYTVRPDYVKVKAQDRHGDEFVIDGKDLLAIRRIQWLSATFRIDDGKTFVSQDGTAAYINTTPVRSAMTDFLRHP